MQKKIDAQIEIINQRLSKAIEEGQITLAQKEIGLLTALVKLSQKIPNNQNQLTPIERRRKRAELMMDLERRFEKIKGS
ncbi:MAG: hypothetical protein J0L55_10515 [Caulobacterales bacterium]|nr:hypothetical protein [Caulobacterales bacterium]MCA0372767.1 hypothetical protein [Pseudomonadota bacterium]